MSAATRPAAVKAMLSGGYQLTKGLIRTCTRLIGLESDSRLWNWQSQARYHLLDIGAVTPDKLSQRDNLVALLFRLEQPYLPDEFGEVVKDVHAWFHRHEGLPELQRLFEQLIRQLLRRSGIREPIPDDLRGILNMIEVQGKSGTELLRVVKNNPQCVSVPPANATHTMPHIHPVHPASPLHRAMMHSKDHPTSLTERHYLRT